MALTAMFLAMSSGPMHAGHAMRHASAPMSLGGLLGSWAAMMLPLVRHQARWLAFRSLRARRQQAVAVFSGAYFAVWMTAGAVALVVLGPVRGEPAALALALAVAACWHCAAPRRRLLLRCGVQRAPAVHGRQAVADWARAGLLAGGRCVATCWALMLPMAIEHHPALMVGAALVLASERRRGPNPERRAARRQEAMWLAAAAAALALVVIVG
jgi:hypothetical protein